MIEILPDLKLSFRCISCHADRITIHKIIFQGKHVLADCTCENCKTEFYNTLPIAHDGISSIQFTKDGKKQNYKDHAKWRAIPLIESITQGISQKANFHCDIVSNHSDVILVNCIDDCFGHVFTKLWNVQSLLKNYPDKGIIVLIPAQCKWLVPVGVSEIWTVEQSLNNLKGYVAGLDDFVQGQLTRFNTVMLSHTYAHLDHTKYLDIASLVKKEPFDLKTFSSKPFAITFVLREDRFWNNSTTFSFLYKCAIKFQVLRFFRSLFIARQNYLVNKSTSRLRKKFPSLKVYATGLGNHLKLHHSIFDLRSSAITSETENLWNETYANSHIVIGVHGSNMLIPSGLAAAFINIVPRYKMDHLTEDTISPYKNRYAQFLGRYLDEYTSSSLLTMHVSGIITRFPYLYNNTEQIPE